MISPLDLTEGEPISWPRKTNPLGAIEEERVESNLISKQRNEKISATSRVISTSNAILSATNDEELKTEFSIMGEASPPDEESSSSEHLCQGPTKTFFTENVETNPGESGERSARSNLNCKVLEMVEPPVEVVPSSISRLTDYPGYPLDRGKPTTPENIGARPQDNTYPHFVGLMRNNKTRKCDYQFCYICREPRNEGERQYLEWLKIKRTNILFGREDNNRILHSTRNPFIWNEKLSPMVGTLWPLDPKLLIRWGWDYAYLHIGWASIRRWVPKSVPGKNIANFLTMSARRYYSNEIIAYHNSLHGGLTAHFMHVLFQHVETGFDWQLDLMIIPTALVAALGHDISHTGRGNAYLTNIAHPFVGVFGPASAEAHSSSILRSILSRPGYSVFENYTMLVHEEMTRMILVTDLSDHDYHLSSLENLSIRDRDIRSSAYGKFWAAIFLKMADISHSTLDWPDHFWWSSRFFEEWCWQVDEERHVRPDIPYSMSRPVAEGMASGQSFFLRNFVLPFFRSAVKNVPDEVSKRFVMECIIARASLNDVYWTLVRSLGRQESEEIYTQRPWETDSEWIMKLELTENKRHEVAENIKDLLASFGNVNIHMHKAPINHDSPRNFVGTGVVRQSFKVPLTPNIISLRGAGLRKSAEAPSPMLKNRTRRTRKARTEADAII